MDDVAAAAGVTKATLYKHFESKDKLVSACLTAVARKHFDWFVDQATQRTGGSASALQAVFLVLDQWFNSSTLKGCAFTKRRDPASEPAASGLPRGPQPQTADPRMAAIPRPGRRLRRPGCSPALSSYLMILMEGAIITALVQNDLDAGRQAGEAAAILIDRFQSQHRDAV